MTNRNAYPNAMRCGTFLSPLLGVPLRPSTPRLSTLLSASQRFVFYFLSPLRSAALRPSPRLYSTQRFVCYNAPNRYAALRPSTQRFVYYFAAPLPAAQRHSTQRFVFSPRYATQLYSAPRTAALLNDLFIIDASLRIAPQLLSTQLNDLFITSLRPSAQRNATRLCAPRLYSTICLLSTPLYALLRNSSLLNSTICLLRRSETPRGSAQRNTTPLNATQLNLNQPTNRRT
tara:strand:+ start:144 stop:836 length:693 start_codon:yes stop_codon:yes gene_type:complete